MNRLVRCAEKQPDKRAHTLNCLDTYSVVSPADISKVLRKRHILRIRRRRSQSRTPAESWPDANGGIRSGHTTYICGQGYALGTLEADRVPNLVIMDGDPLRDIEAVSRVSLVIKNGESVSAAE